MPENDRRFDPKKCDALISAERWSRWDPPRLIGMSGLRGGQSVLDLGSGPGFWTFPLAEVVGPAGKVIALDVSSELLAALLRRNPPSHVQTLQAELPAIPLPDATVDFVWAAFVFHEVHPPTDLAGGMRRVLRPGGRIAILDWRPDAAGTSGPPRQHRYSSAQVAEYLTAAGFGEVRQAWQNEDAYLLTAE